MIPIPGTILTNLNISQKERNRERKRKKDGQEERKKVRKIEKKKKKIKERRGVCCSSLVDCNPIVKNRYFKSQKFQDI